MGKRREMIKLDEYKQKNRKKSHTCRMNWTESKHASSDSVMCAKLQGRKNSRFQTNAHKLWFSPSCSFIYFFFKFKLEKKRKFKSRAHFLWFFLQCGVFIKLSSLIFISLHLTRKLYFKEEILSDSSGNLMNATGWWICKCISHVSSWICILFAIWMQMRSRTANW